MSEVSVRIPTPLRTLTGGAGKITVQASTVGDALKHLEEQHSDLKGRVLDADGNLRGFVNVFLGDTDIRRLEGLETAVGAGSTIAVLPAVAGGRK